MAINVIERATVPYNSSGDKVVNKEQYVLYAPAAGIEKPGMAGFDAEHFAVAEQIVRLSNAFLASLIRHADKSVSVNAIKEANTIYSNFSCSVIDRRNSVGSAQYKNVTGNLLVLRDEDCVTEILFAEGSIWIRKMIVTGNTVGAGDFEPLFDKSVSSSQLRDGAVTSPKIADNAITNDKLADKVITNDKLADNAVDTSKLEGSLKAHVMNAFSSVSYDAESGKLIFGGIDSENETTIDLPLELLIKSGRYDEDTNDIVLVLANGDSILIPLDDVIEKINSFLEDKVDKLEDADVVYATDSDGNTVGIPIGGGAYEIVKRTREGHVDVPITPESVAHAASKKYVDDGVEAVSNRVTANTESIGNLDAKTEENKRRIDNLEGTLIKYTEDSSEVYAKSVPTNSAHKAILNRVGGKTIKKGSKNICTDAVEGGIPFTAPLGDSYILNIPLLAGTYSYYANVDIESEHRPDYVRFWDGVAVFSNPFTLEESRTVYYEIDNFESYCTGDVTGKLYLNIVEGTEIPTEYEPYVAPYLEPTKVTEIVSVGKNLLDGSLINCEKRNGVSVTYDADTQIFTFNGTSNKAGDLGSTYLNLKGTKGKNYLLRVEILGGSVSELGTKYAVVYFGSSDSRDTHSNWLSSNRLNGDSSKLATLTHEYITRFWFYIDKDVSFNNFQVRVMLAKTDFDGPYVPYFKKSYPIPEEIQKREGYGYSVDDVCDEINFDSKKYANRVAPLVLNGTEKWEWYNYSQYVTPFFALHVSDVDESIVNVKLICSHYEQDYNLLISDDNGIAWVKDTTDYYLAIRDNRFTSVTEFKAHLDKLAANDTPVTVVYELPNPTETDLSPVLTDYPDYKFIEVQRGGELIAENKNKNKNPVPWTVTFAET